MDHGVGNFNGDMGILKEIDEYAQTVLIQYEEQRPLSNSYAQQEQLELD